MPGQGLVLNTGVRELSEIEKPGCVEGFPELFEGSCVAFRGFFEDPRLFNKRIPGAGPRTCRRTMGVW